MRANAGSPSPSEPAGRIRGLMRCSTRLRLNSTSASPAASTFFTQFVLPWPSAMAKVLPLRYVVTMVS